MEDFLTVLRKGVQEHDISMPDGTTLTRWNIGRADQDMSAAATVIAAMNEALAEAADYIEEVGNDELAFRTRWVMVKTSPAPGEMLED